MSCKDHFKQLYNVIAEAIKDINIEEVQIFNKSFDQKPQELCNEQATNLQEDTGASR